MRLFAYKLTDDTGFAPNPFHGFCTLATCKPQIRLHKRPGDWVAGFTSVELNDDAMGAERLVYLMQVSEKLSLAEYHRDDRFRAKIPVRGARPRIAAMGDNIYRWDEDRYVQVPNHNHGPENFARDVSGEFVLIATTFCYFGSCPVTIPDEIRPKVTRRQSGGGVQTSDVVRAQALIDFVLVLGLGVNAAPTKWRDGDVSWKQARADSF